ncbi:MAG: AAA family ATPase [Ferrovibrio sp.]
MKLVRFEIKNFKGIAQTTIGLSDEIPGNIISLIGLNESGKTTILEALSHFLTEDQETASLVGTVHQKSAIQDLIPKDRKAAFTGNVSIKAIIDLEDSDLSKLTERFRDKDGLVLDSKDMQRRIWVERSYQFEDSTYKGTSRVWSVAFTTRTKTAKKFQKNDGTIGNRDVWLKGLDHLSEMMPRIVYFPTFLFNFPDRIYLEEGQAEEPNNYYKNVIQDVLDSQGEKLSVQRHIVERIKKHRDGFQNPATAFLAHFFGLDEKNQIDAVMQKISNEMSKVIFGAWSDILARSVSKKRVQVDWLLDGEKSNSPYLQVWIIDGQSKYALSERSLGFRWFFSFLLFTQFRKNRSSDSGTIFIFDEPASNLHSRAQIKLLESFLKIAGGPTYIIYSTHSHYMINPLWLEKAYIIENKAVDYDDDDQVDSFAVRKTDIHAIKYRSFVASNPSKTTYFQPVLDSLQVAFSPLERSKHALIVEGKFDYHPFVYLRGKMGSDTNLPEIFPANGAGGVGHLINLFRGWGVNFRILLDDDKAGHEAKKLYIKDYLIAPAHVVTLGEIHLDLKGKSFEAIYQSDVRAEAAQYFNVGEEKISKRQFALFFQDKIATKSDAELPETQKVFMKINEWVDQEFSAKNPSQS